MKIAARVLDKASGLPLVGADVILTDTEGNVLGGNATTNSAGAFQLDSPLLDQADVWVTVEAKGYKSGDFPPARFLGGAATVVDLEVLPPAQLKDAKTETRPAVKNYALPLALALCAVVAIGLYMVVRKQ